MSIPSRNWRLAVVVLLSTLAVSSVGIIAKGPGTSAGSSRPASLLASGTAVSTGIPPVACFKVGPFRAPASTLFSVDASCSHDDATLTADLQVRWDWENDGVWDLPASGYAIDKKATHVFSAAGTYTIKLEVLDGEGLTSQATITVTVGGDTTISESRFSGSSAVAEVSLAVDPSNSDRVGIAANFQPPFFSINGGTTYGSSTLSETGNDPRVAFDSSGNLYFSKMRTPDYAAVRIFKSADGGQTYPSFVDFNVFGQAVTMPDGTPGTICGTSVDFPVLGADSHAASPYRDNLYVNVAGGADFGGGCRGYGMFWRSTDHGATWTGRAFDSGTVDSLPVAPDGTLWYVGKGYPYCPAQHVNFLKSTDGGATFTNGCVPSTFGSQQFHAVAIDPADSSNVWMVMAASNSGPKSIYVARTTDAGATWSDWTRVDDVLSPDTFDKSYPVIGVTNTGGQPRVHVAWADPRNAPTGSNGADIYYSYSTDGGATWAPNILAAPALAANFYMIPGNDYITLDVAGPRVHIGYASDRDGDLAWEGYDVTVTTPASARPTAPVDPTVAATTVNTLEWSPPASNGNSPLTSVEVYRGTSPGAATHLATLAAQDTLFIDSDLTPGQTYYYQVSTVNALGEGPRSSEVAPLGPPAALMAYGSPSRVDLMWSAPANDGGTPVTDYDIYRSTTSGGEVFLERIGPSTTYTDYAVTTGLTYYYRVSAIASTGEGPQSTEASALTVGDPTPPQALVATGGNAVVNLSWQPPVDSGGLPITNYYIYRGTTSGGQGGNVIAILGNVTSYSDERVTNGTTYYYTATALNSAGHESHFSNEASAMPRLPDLYFVCPATSTTYGSTTSCPNMQNAADGDAVATLTETQAAKKWRFDQTYNSNGTGPAGAAHTLEVRGYVSATAAEQLDVQVFNFATSRWTTRLSFLTSDTSLILKTWTLSANEWNNGSPRIRFLDSTNDNSQSTWFIEYARVLTPN